LEDFGLLEPQEENGLFASADAHVVRLMAAFEEARISLEDVARGVSAGELSFPSGLFLPEPVELSETYEGLAGRCGRLTGGPPATQRRADRAVRQRVATFDLSSAERDSFVYGKAAGFTELVSGLVPWLQRRHREHAVLEYLVGVTEGYMEERGITPRQPKQPPAIAFLDLTGYTTLAEERGDQAAAELAADLASIVQEAAQNHGGRPVKWLGDGVMFHFTDPGGAIVSGLEVIEQTERTLAVPARIGINAGAVVAQEGDYFGRTVNIAARIADFARPHEVLVSDDAKRSAAVADVEFELVGDVPLKGVAKSVRLHRATRA